ncbi:hypothetical protein EU528_11305 [Candidatus Thorarchaeota archaeon]|nr:MAG: hypothetical protein EU528_11305 [Candidatus Thorarchaeota archaeon]
MSDKELEAYAKEQINAVAYADDVHTCNHFRCSKCEQVVPVSLLISYSEACDDARPAQDFAGTVYGTCGKCGSTDSLFGIIRGSYLETEEEHPVCSCGSNSFFVCMCERYEGAQGLQGFFDEGVLVGKCSKCGSLRTFLFTD